MKLNFAEKYENLDKEGETLRFNKDNDTGDELKVIKFFFITIRIFAMTFRVYFIYSEIRSTTLRNI